MRSGLHRFFRSLAALACVFTTHFAVADPALSWPGFGGDAARQLASRSTGGDPRHLYLFGSPGSWQTPIVWNYNDAGRPDGIVVDAVVQGISAAAQQWMDACRVDIHRGADSTAVPQDMDGDNVSPGENVIGWGDLTLGVHGSPLIAAYTWAYGGAGATIDGFDMTLSRQFVESPEQLARVVVHEFGHALGLAHSNVPDAVMSGPGGLANPGVPDTPYDSVAALTDDDKHGCLCLYGPGDALAAQGYLCGLPPVAQMGIVPIGGMSSPRNVTMTNRSTASSLTIHAIALGNPELVKSTGCAAGTTLAPGESCSFDLVFKPSGRGGVRLVSYVAIQTTNGVGTYRFPVTAIAADAGGAASAAPPIAKLTPASLDFGAIEVGGASAPAAAILSNAGGGVLTISSITPTTPDATVFLRDGSCVAGSTLAAAQSCSVQVRFAPNAAGVYGATIEVATNAGTQQLVLTGTGAASTDGTSAVVEYYNAALDHYFITASAIEIAVLDAGAPAGWARTGYAFRTYLVAHPGTSPVCRYYIPPAQGNSHFFSVLPSECNAIPALYPAFEFEGASVMYMYVPDLASGACPAGSIPAYRVWNRRPDTNHRYTTDRALRDRMVALGYAAEGYGPDAVGMCAPP
jgi:matrixin/HYDIN/CFA65/VesB family protein